MKLAVYFRQRTLGSDAVVKRMLRAQTLRPHQMARTFDLPQGAVGCVVTSERFSSVPLLRHGINGNLLLVSGVPISLNEPLDFVLDSVRDGDFRRAVDYLSRLDGIFAALFWDGLNQRLVVVTDFLGLQPLYIFQSKDMLLMASELKGIAASGLLPVEMDPVGWASFLSFGHFLGNSTSLEGMQRVSPGTAMVFDPGSGFLEQHTYAAWPNQGLHMNRATDANCLRHRSL